jgi:hypothetical protein
MFVILFCKIKLENLGTIPRLRLIETKKQGKAV